MNKTTTLFTVVITTALLCGGVYIGRMTLPQGSTCMVTMPVLPLEGDE